MRVNFTAEEGNFEANEDTLACGLSGEGKWLVFQRDSEDSEEDWGIHLEYNDQSNGEYDCIAACRLGPKLLAVDLSRQLGRLSCVTGFDVALRLGPEQYEKVRLGLRRVFRNYLNLLVEAEPGSEEESGGI